MARCMGRGKGVDVPDEGMHYAILVVIDSWGVVRIAVTFRRWVCHQWPAVRSEPHSKSSLQQGLVVRRFYLQFKTLRVLISIVFRCD